MLLNSNLFNQISFFLSGKTIVNSLESGAKLYGGATKIENVIYSNIEGDNNIKINENNNSISLFIPSTLNTDTEVDSKEYVTKYFNSIDKHFNNATLFLHNASGSWFSDDLQKIVIEDIVLIEVVSNTLSQSDINFMLNLGLNVKRDMNQESVSVSINDSLCLV
jgi:hypothetical protein